MIGCLQRFFDVNAKVISSLMKYCTLDDMKTIPLKTHGNFKLMCDLSSLLLDFRGEFLSVGGQEKYFLVSIKISFCPNKTCKNFENRSADKKFMAKMNIE